MSQRVMAEEYQTKQEEESPVLEPAQAAGSSTEKEIDQLSTRAVRNQNTPDEAEASEYEEASLEERFQWLRNQLEEQPSQPIAIIFFCRYWHQHGRARSQWRQR